MKIINILFLQLLILIVVSCASSYNNIAPNFINYQSSSKTDSVSFMYKYDLLDRKYAKKELKKSIKLVAIKIKNSSDEDLTFGKDIILSYQNGNDVIVMENEKVYQELKQTPAYYLFYLLLTPLQFYQTDSNGNIKSSKPIGLIIGPGIAFGNMIVANSANNKFKTELFRYNLNGTIIPKGETKTGLIGIRSDSFEALELRFIQ